MFPSFMEHPHNYHFEGQDPDEDILLLLRAHPITNLKWIIPAVLFSLIPFFAPFLIPFTGINLWLLPQIYLLVFLLINYLIVLVITFEGFLYWYFNVYILTDRRVVDIDFHSILFKSIDLAPLTQVQEANSSVAGLLGIIFNFGIVYIQTAGAQIAIDFHDVPDPHRVADRIMDEVHKIERKK